MTEIKGPSKYSEKINDRRHSSDFASAISTQLSTPYLGPEAGYL